MQKWQSWRDPWPLNSLASAAGTMLMNDHIDLRNLGDPLPLAFKAVQGPEIPMGRAATARFSLNGRVSSSLVGIPKIIVDNSRHALV